MVNVALKLGRIFGLTEPAYLLSFLSSSLSFFYSLQLSFLFSQPTSGSELVYLVLIIVCTVCK